ncbi:MAG TPA: hypothetical protein PLZ32_08175 [Saprospiraceae bacterium]|nr:hypothetical protein [Saprospiraceae bacterium]
MELNNLVQEIKRLPLAKRFFVIEQTLKSIKNEELSQHIDDDFENETDLSNSTFSLSEKSLATDWLSTEDNRWDKIL